MSAFDVIEKDPDGTPILLANGRMKNDGLCLEFEHAYPNLGAPVFVKVGGTFQRSQTCISCRVTRIVVLNDKGEIMARRYQYPKER
jgi:hypothetical protein